MGRRPSVGKGEARRPGWLRVLKPGQAPAREGQAAGAAAVEAAAAAVQMLMCGAARQ